MHTFANGEIFEGELVNGKREGHRSMKYANGDMYDGNFKHNLQDGYGVYAWAIGDVYDGQWKGGKYHGRGRFVWKHGEEYDGDWKNDMKHGDGTYLYGCEDREEYKEGLRLYTGEWKKDEKCGIGTAIYVNDNDDDKYDKYEGNWRGNMRHGHGKFTHGDDGTTIEGNFRDHYLHGECRQTFENGDVYVGTWKKNKKHGKGTTTKSNGEVYEQVYKQGRLAVSKKKVAVANESDSRGECDAPVLDGGGEGVGAERTPSKKRGADASVGEAPCQRGRKKKKGASNGRRYGALPFRMFYEDLRVRQPGCTTVAAGAAWRNLSPGEKEVYTRRAEEIKRRDALLEEQGGVADRGDGESGGGRDEWCEGEQQQHVQAREERNDTTNSFVDITLKEENESEIHADVPGSCGAGQAAGSRANDTHKLAAAAAANPGQSTNHLDAKMDAEGGSQGQRQQPARARWQQNGTSHCRTTDSVIDAAAGGDDRSGPRVDVPGSCGAGQAARSRADNARRPAPAANPESTAASSSNATGMRELELGRLYETIKEKRTRSESIFERKFYGHLKSYCGRTMRDGVLLSPLDVEKINNLMGRFESNMRLLNDKTNDIDDIYVYEGFVNYIIKECERELPMVAL